MVCTNSVCLDHGHCRLNAASVLSIDLFSMNIKVTQVDLMVVKSPHNRVLKWQQKSL